ncbi:MAG: hypothetical protein MnENMB40S_02150 [Rhizobiaceae bacterium MnEN-MB40S]|nr:MAG: hypothetical protein MnENMB40S_02150 [Rhizobiaceae bacterium MnEN-MB40S]
MNLISAAGTRIKQTYRVSDYQSSETIMTSTIVACAEELVSAAESMHGFAVLDFLLHNSCVATCEQFDITARLMDRRGSVATWELHAETPDARQIARMSVSMTSDDEPAVKMSKVSPAEEAPATAPAVEKAAPGDKRELIAEAACRVIAEKGFAASTMREIAREASMHVPTMYQYVRSKEEVLELIYHHLCQRIRVTTRPVFEADLPPREKLKAVINCLIHVNGSLRKGSGVMNRELKSLSPSARRRVLDDYAEIVDKIANIITEGIESGAFRPTNKLITANFIDAMCDIWVLRPFAIEGIGEQDYIDHVVDFTLNGLLDTASGST